MKVEEAIAARYTIHSRSGNELVIRCPSDEHDDTNPSAWVNVKKGLWLCFSCHASGRVEDIIDGEVRLEPVQIDDLEAALEGLREHDRFKPESWLSRFTIWDEVMQYWWGARGISAEIIEEFKLGFDPHTNCATYPIRSPKGGVYGVTRRRLGDRKPKYLYPKGVKMHNLLFGFYEMCVRELPIYKRNLALVEGAVDALAMWDAGIPALAQYSSQLHPEQIELIRRYRPVSVTLMYDNDEAGRKATEQAIDSDLGLHSLVYVCDWSEFDAKDVADLDIASRQELFDTGDLSLTFS